MTPTTSNRTQSVVPKHIGVDVTTYPTARWDFVVLKMCLTTLHILDRKTLRTFPQ